MDEEGSPLFEDQEMMLYGYGDPVQDLGLYGTTRYAVEVDLAWLYGLDAYEDYFLTHFTMECGNDNLIGENAVPEPASMLLLGSGMIGLAAFGRRKFLKKS